jgi:hypothetical protein
VAKDKISEQDKMMSFFREGREDTQSSELKRAAPTLEFEEQEPKLD